LVGVEVVTVMTVKSTVFWDISSCSPIVVTDISEEGTACLKGRGVNKSRNQKTSDK
jgi:hypothetical protein